jgi:hypothetical protein
VVGVIAVAIGLERLTFIEKISESQAAVGDVVRGFDRLATTLEDASITSILTDHRRYLPPRLSELFGEVVGERLSRIRGALRNGEIFIDNKEAFEFFYVKVLQSLDCSRCHLTATSLPSAQYFWTPRLQQAIHDFIGRGGRMTRIFYVERDYLLNAAVRSILDEQAKMNVVVKTVDYGLVPPALQSRFLLYEEELSIGWEVAVGALPHIRDVTISANREKLDSYRVSIASLNASVYRPHVDQS